MTSVGYGDIGPKRLGPERSQMVLRNDLEMGICTGFTWAYVLGQICTIVSGMNEALDSGRVL